MADTARPSVCLLHADVHDMDQECWRVAITWYQAHQDLPAVPRRDAYQAAAEARMLAELRSAEVA